MNIHPHNVKLTIETLNGNEKIKADIPWKMICDLKDLHNVNFIQEAYEIALKELMSK